MRTLASGYSRRTSLSEVICMPFVSVYQNESLFQLDCCSRLKSCCLHVYLSLFSPLRQNSDQELALFDIISLADCSFACILWERGIVPL